MKRHLIWLAVVALLVAPCVAAAQAVSGGIKGGVVFGDVPRLATNFGDEGGDMRMRIGMAAGGFVTIPINDQFAFQVEGLYTQKGLSGTDPFGDDDFGFRFDYIDVPLLVRMQVSRDRGVYGLVGPSINFKVGAEIWADTEDTEDVSDDIESIEWAFVAAVGYQMKHFVIEGRYMEGLTNIIAPADEVYKTRSFAILAGFRFR